MAAVSVKFGDIGLFRDTVRRYAQGDTRAKGEKENPSRLPLRLASLATRTTTGRNSVTIRAVTLASYYTLVLVSLISLMT